MSGCVGSSRKSAIRCTILRAETVDSAPPRSYSAFISWCSRSTSSASRFPHAERVADRRPRSSIGRTPDVAVERTSTGRRNRADVRGLTGTAGSQRRSVPRDERSPAAAVDASAFGRDRQFCCVVDERIAEMILHTRPDQASPRLDVGTGPHPRVDEQRAGPGRRAGARDSQPPIDVR